MSTALALPLNTEVVYRGERATVTGRCKPVGEPWRYDLDVGRRTHVGVRADEIRALTDNYAIPIADFRRSYAPNQ